MRAYLRANASKFSFQRYVADVDGATRRRRVTWITPSKRSATRGSKYDNPPSNSVGVQLSVQNHFSSKSMPCSVKSRLISSWKLSFLWCSCWFLIYVKQNAVFVFDNAPNVLVQIFPMLLPNCLFASFCAKNNVVQYLTICRHNKYFLQRYVFCWTPTEFGRIVFRPAPSYTSLTRGYLRTSPSDFLRLKQRWWKNYFRCLCPAAYLLSSVRIILWRLQSPARTKLYLSIVSSLRDLGGYFRYAMSVD